MQKMPFTKRKAQDISLGLLPHVEVASKSNRLQTYQPLVEDRLLVREVFAMFLLVFIGRKPLDFWYNITRVGKNSLGDLMNIEGDLLHAILITCDLTRMQKNDGKITYAT